MRRFVRVGVIFIFASSIGACSDGPSTAPERTFPEPVEVFDDSQSVAAVKPPAPPPLAQSSVSPVQAQFECAAGARDVTGGMRSDAADRPDENGQTIKARVYDPGGAQVFGFPVTVFETYTYADGRSGVAAYVAPNMAAVLPAILARFPGSSSADSRTVTGPGMAGPITLREASLGDATLTRIECARAG